MCSAPKLLTDAAPVPVMAANHKLARLRRKKKRLRAKYKKQRVNRGQRRRRSPSPSPSSCSDDSSSSSSSSSSDGASRKRRRSRSRSMSAASLAEANARAICNKEADAYFDEIREGHARYMAATAQARLRKVVRDGDRELDRALSRIEFERCCPICCYAPCRCERGGGGHHRCPEANRDLAVEEARMRAEAGVLEARLQKQRAEDALSDYLASRPKRARVEEIEDAAPEPKRVRASG